MIKFLLLIFLAFTAVFVCAQNLVITGKVFDSNDARAGKLYYAAKGKKFSSKRFISYSADKKYTFKMAIAQIKKDSIESIYFVTDTNSNPLLPHACAHVIHVGKIVRSSYFKGKNSIVINSDLFPYFHCDEGIYYGADEDGKAQYTGSYALTVNDTVHKIYLSAAMYIYRADLSIMTSQYMLGERGDWGINTASNELVFSIDKQYNEEFGTVLKKNIEYTFTIVPLGDPFVFEGKVGTLKKLY